MQIYALNILRVSSLFSEKDAFDKDYSKGYCAPYNGQICKKFLQGRGLVWFNISQVRRRRRKLLQVKLPIMYVHLFRTIPAGG